MPELFASVEVNRQPRWPIILRLLAGSLLLHLALAASVVYIPTARDLFGIAGMARHSKFVERPYTKTVIGEDIHLLQFSSKFHYPAGYFGDTVIATATPSPAPDPFAPRIISEARDWKETHSPPPTPNAAVAVNPSPSPAPGKTADAQAGIDDALHKAAAANNVVVPDEDEINKLPLKDWLARSVAMRENKQLDLDAVVEITIEANLNSSCKLSAANVVRKSGDPRMITVATDLASAISDSKVLSILQDPTKHNPEGGSFCEPGPLRLVLKLDQNEVNARVESQASSPDRAAQRARTYNLLLAIGAIKRKDNDEGVIFRNTMASSEGATIIVHFKMPREPAGALLKKQVEPKPAKAS